MKVRTGFVSNSSTSSFLVFGFRLSGDEVARALCVEYEYDAWNELRKSGLEYVADTDGGIAYIGKVIIDNADYAYSVPLSALDIPQMMAVVDGARQRLKLLQAQAPMLWGGVILN